MILTEWRRQASLKLFLMAAMHTTRPQKKRLLKMMMKYP
jgi:hypothetical protein